MTAQVTEVLIYEGKKMSICTEPLSNYFVLNGNKPQFVSPHTALWRGYVGTWEIIDDRLYLTHIEGIITDVGPASISSLFPDYPILVFAHWYSGTLRIPQGKLLNYFHGGYGSTYERDIFLEFKKGILVNKVIKENEYKLEEVPI
jgi:hypothetical protein